MTIGVWLAIAAAGAVGAPLRYVVDGAIAQRRGGEFPLGTLVINCSGSFVLGLLSGLVLFHAFPATPKLVLGTGFCGAYTTFSTFSFETIALARQGSRLAAALNVATSVLGGCAAAAAGLLLAAA